MTFCHRCGLKLTGNENFCPQCGIKLQQSKTIVHNNNQSIGVQHTTGDVMGTGVSGSGNITAKFTNGNIIYINNLSVSSEQLRTIMTYSTTLDVSQSYNTARDLDNLTQTKQQTAHVLEEINKIEKQEGREIREIKVGKVQVSKNELLLKELFLKGNEFYYKREYEKSIQYYDKVLEIDPKYSDAWNNKGFALYKLGKYNEAIEYFYNKGLALYKLGKYNEAIEYFDKALDIDPKYAYAWNNKGFALYKLVKYNEAIEYFDKALEIDPRYVNAWINKGNAFYSLGKYNEAIECYDKALEIVPKHALAMESREMVFKQMQN